jgi:hypothetical protein
MKPLSRRALDLAAGVGGGCAFSSPIDLYYLKKGGVAKIDRQSLTN